MSALILPDGATDADIERIAAEAVGQLRAEGWAVGAADEHQMRLALRSLREEARAEQRARDGRLH